MVGKPIEDARVRAKAVLDGTITTLNLRDAGNLKDLERKVKNGDTAGLSRETFEDLFSQFVRVNELKGLIESLAKAYGTVAKLMWKHFGCKQLMQYTVVESMRSGWDGEKLDLLLDAHGLDKNIFMTVTRFPKFQRIKETIKVYDIGNAAR